MIFNKTVGRVCNIKHTFTYFIKHNKMTLFPMHYARQRHIVFKLFGGDMNAECLESYVFGSLLSFANKQDRSPWHHVGSSRGKYVS